MRKRIMPPPGVRHGRPGGRRLTYADIGPPKLVAWHDTTVYMCVRRCGRRLRDYQYALDPEAALAELTGAPLDRRFDVRYLPALYARGDMDAYDRDRHREAILFALANGFDLLTARPPTDRAPQSGAELDDDEMPF